MELQERKMKILQAIVRNYLETGEPVGSRTISKSADLKLSSATIRNEMADLEEMGLIMQPHTSAGRIPTDAGYRIYVDHMLRQQRDEVEEMKSLLIQKQDRLDKQLREVARLLASSTQYASVVTTPSVRKNKIKFIQLSQVDPGSLLAVIVMEADLIRNTMIRVEQELTSEQLLKLNLLLNTSLCGLPVEDITLGLIESIKRKAGIHTQIISDVIDAAAGIVHQEEELEVFTSGAPNILRYPELTDGARASEIIESFEEKKTLGEIVHTSSAGSEETGIQVYIGSEMPVPGMQDCSIVTATYDLGDGMKGTVGIIGPKRMNYEKVVSVLKKMKRELDDMYRTTDAIPEETAGKDTEGS